MTILSYAGRSGNGFMSNNMMLRKRQRRGNQVAGSKGAHRSTDRLRSGCFGNICIPMVLYFNYEKQGVVVIQ